MITGFLISLVLGVVTGLFSLLPAWSADTGVVSGQANGAGTFLGAFDDYLPERTIVACLALLLVIKLAMFVWRLLVFVYGLIPGKAT
jgi:hypothetical protein